MSPEAVALRASALAKKIALLDSTTDDNFGKSPYHGFLSPFTSGQESPAVFEGDPSGRRAAVTAAQDARDAKNEIVALGTSVINHADNLALAQLIEEGLVPNTVTNLDEHVIELTGTTVDLPDTSSASIQGTAELKGLRKSLVDSLSDEEYQALAQEVKDTYGLINGLAETEDELELDITRGKDPIASVAYLNGVAYGLRFDDRVPAALEGNEKFHKEMLELTGEKDGLTPLGTSSVIARFGNQKDLRLSDVMGGLLIARNHENAMSRYKEIVNNLREYNEKRLMLEDTLRKINKRRHEIIREKSIELLKAAGFEFDSVGAADFGGTLDMGRKTFDTLPVLERSWEFLPRNMLLKAIETMKRKRSRLTVNFRGGRAGYNKGSLHGSDTGAFLHEQGHWIEDTVEGIAYLEHAFLSDRASKGNGKLSKVVAADGKLGAAGDEISLSDVGLTQQYSGRMYKMMSSGLMTFSPKNRFFEVFTTGLEDLFTNTGYYSNGNTQKVVIGRGVNTETLYNAYKDPRTGVWYRDSSKSERITPVKVVGRSYQDGMDVEFKGFTLGLLMMMHDWK